MADRTHAEYQAAEVLWYERNGRFPKERIVTGGDGQPYVIGDQHWNQGRRPREWIERQMQHDLIKERTDV